MTGRRTRRHLTGISAAGLAVVVMLALSAGAGAAPDGAKPCGPAGSGGAGADSFRGGPGKDCFSGGAGEDLLGGGGGADKLGGGPGDDKFLPGGGADRVRAGKGRDLIFARDGVAETISCGPGRDSANADAADVMRGCERVVLRAADVQWAHLYTHINAYGYAAILPDKGWGKCSGDSHSASCKGRSEEGDRPFEGGREISMSWSRSSTEPGQNVRIEAPQSDSELRGYSDPGWVWLSVNNAEIPSWANPYTAIIRSGRGGGLNTQGGPMQAYLSYHSYDWPSPRANGYSLDLRGWLQIIRL